MESNNFSSEFTVPPEIKVPHPTVHTRPGLQAKLECLVNSHPAAQVHWFFNGSPVSKRNNLVTTQEIDLVKAKR
jgi:hypothetical protein